MKNDIKTRAQLIEELTELRQHVTELEASLSSPKLEAESSSMEQTVAHVEIERSVDIQKTADFMGREVSCRSLGILFQELQKKGLPPETLTMGMEYSLEHLLNKHERIDWLSYQTLMTNAGSVWSDKELVEMGGAFMKSPWARPIVSIAGLLFTAKDFYRWTARPGPIGARDFSCIQPSFRELGPNHLEIKVIMQSGYEPCREFFLVTKGVMIAIPTMVGLARAFVELEEFEGGACYRIQVPPGGGALAWLRKMFAYPFTARTAARELQEAYEVLQVRYLELEAQIAERKRVEEALQQANLVIENSPVVLFRWQAAEGWPVVLVSENVRRFGYTPEELLTGKIPYAKIVHPKDLERVVREVQEHSASGNDQFRQEYRIMNRDGQVRWIDDRTLIERDTEGNITHYQGTIIDITERVEAEQALRESEERYRTLFEMAPDAIAIHSDGKVKFLNPAGYGMFRITSPEHVIDRPIQEFVHPDNWENTRNRMFRFLSTGKGVTYPVEDLYVCQDGTPIPVEVTAVRLTYQGKPSIQIIIRDITGRKRVEEERERLIKELEARNTELERFTYTVSHDLKSPLITIKGFLGLLEQDVAKNDVEQLHIDIQHIREATDTMHQLLDDLLELSRIGRMMNPPQEVPFGDLAHEALERVAGQIAECDVQITISPDLPIVYGDRLRLLEVLQNLIDNAVKFMGDQSEPQIKIGVQPGAHGPVLYVADNGIGVEPRYYEKVFGLFERLDPEVEGTGVGLALVKRIIEMHGGRIWVESEGPGRGSTFYFTLAQKAE